MEDGRIYIAHQTPRTDIPSFSYGEKVRYFTFSYSFLKYQHISNRVLSKIRTDKLPTVLEPF